MREVRTGVWHWEARHPEWNERQWWGPLVSSYAIDDGARLLLFDPLAVPSEIFEHAEDRETAIVLTCPWHERDARSLVERFGWPVFAPPSDTQEDLMQKFGVSAEQAAGGSPDLAWLRDGDGEAHWYAAGDRLPVGVEAFPGMESNDLVLWVASHRVLVAGDTLQDRGNGLQFLGDLPNNVPAERGVARDQILEGMQPLLALPVEIVLLTHGAPADRAALERALTTSPTWGTAR